MTIRFTPSDDVRHRIEDHVLWVTVDRPAKRNPLSLGVLERLRQIFGAAAAHETLRCAILTGAGDKAFASGGDLGELAAYRTSAEAEGFSRHGKAALDAIRHFPVPVIARINGVALGGGAELALACDQRLAAANARIGLIHAHLAISPSWGGGNDLVRLLGPAKALRLLASAEVLGATQAAALGLVDATCPETEDFDGWFMAMTEPFRTRPPQVLRALKAITAARDTDRAMLDALETRHFGQVWKHPDHWSAIADPGRG